MKNKFKIPLVSFLLCSSLSLQAQYNDAEEDIKRPVQATLQFKGGMNLSGLTARSKGDYENSDIKVGYHLGIYSDITLKKNFYMHTGLSLTSKGADFDDIDVSMNAVYLQVPFYFGAKIDLPNPDLKFKLAVGPYFAYGVAGKTSLRSSDGYYPGAEIGVDTFSDNGLWNRFDFGIGLEANLEFNQVVFGLSLESGITNAWKSKNVEGNVRVTNQVIGLSVGYNFK